MKSLFFILLAGYAVRSDENNYYVIEMPEDPPIQAKKPFKVYWNVPTMQCLSKKIPFENLYEDFGIMQNDNDRFKGEKVTILYDPGLFPALFKNETSGKFRFRNGGVPQEGDLTKHLDAFKEELDHSIPHKNFSGVGIIDFESWRPVFRQNFGVLEPYKDVSVEIERKLHWWWKKAWLEAEAKRRFEEAARTFMQTTLSVAKQLRPNARWGFYGFPYCFNMASNNMLETCAKGVPRENDRISWLWSESTALYPSVYSSVQLSRSQLAALIRGRVREASRSSGVGGDREEILPYFWFRYRDAGFLTETDLATALSTLYESNATGILIWGSSNDVNTVDKCNKLLNYVKNTLGPAIAKYTKPTNKLNDENYTDITTSSPDINLNTNSPLFNDLSTKLYMDPEYHWSPPENYSQEIKNHVDEEIKRKFSHNVTDNNDKHTVLQINNVLIDLILNTVLNNEDSTSSTSTDTLKTKNDKKSQQENDDLISSTEEVNAKISTDTSQVTNGVVTHNPIIYENKNMNQQLELEIVYTTGENVETTTEKAVAQTELIDKISSYLLIDSEINKFMTVIPTTEKLDDFGTTENDYDATLDSDDDYFFNVETFINHNLRINPTTDDPIGTTTDFVSKFTESHKKEFQASTAESFVTQNLNTGTDISVETTTDKNFRLEFQTENTDVDSTTNISLIDKKYTNPTEIVINPTERSMSVKTKLNHDNSDKENESNAYIDEFTVKTTENYDIETYDAPILTLDSKDSNNLENLKMINVTDVTISKNRNGITTPEIETSITTIKGKSTTIVSTSIEQVVV